MEGKFPWERPDDVDFNDLLERMKGLDARMTAALASKSSVRTAAAPSDDDHGSFPGFLCSAEQSREIMDNVDTIDRLRTDGLREKVKIAIAGIRDKGHAWIQTCAIIIDPCISTQRIQR